VEENPARLRVRLKNGEKPLEFAFRHGVAPNVLVYLIEQTAEEDLRLPDCTYNRTRRGLPLFVYLSHAKYNADLTVVRLLVSKHPEALQTIDSYNGCFASAPSMLASISSGSAWALLCEKQRAPSEDAVFFALALVSRSVTKADPTRPSSTPLANNASSRIIRELVRLHPDSVNTPDPDLWFPFHFSAAYDSHIAVLSYLMDTFKGGRIEALRTADRHGWLPLHCAVRLGASSFRLVQWMVENEPTAVSTRDNFGGLPLHCLCQGESTSEV